MKTSRYRYTCPAKSTGFFWLSASSTSVFMFMIPSTAMFTRTNSLERNTSYYLPSELLQESNWDEELPKCPKQMNETDCGVFTCLFAKHLISEECNYSYIKLDQPRDEMAGDLLSLTTAGTNRVQDLPENLQRMPTTINRQRVSLPEKLPVQVSVMASLRHPKTETVYFTQ